MSVTNYNPSASICKYTYSKLKDVIYIVSKDHVKDVYIDDGDAYISGLTELPLRLNGFNITLNEESSLDERYKFQKTVTLSMHGYVNASVFGGKYYVILESEDGTFWMVNIDFPSRLTYTFHLAKDTYQTDFTLASLSNFPILRLIANFEAVSPPCLGFNIYGVDTLKLLEKDYCGLDEENRTVYTYSSKPFQDVEFLGDSCSMEEVFDGEKLTTTIQFNIAFDAYKSSWHYNLLEFLENLYSAIITPKGGTNTFYAGFNFGLQPSFTVQTSSQNNESDIITVTLVEISNHGSTAALDWSEEQTTDTRWIYIKRLGDVVCYECVDFGVAKYLVQQEISKNGTPTGRYKVLQGYASQFPSLNIVGTFENEQLFNNPECDGTTCKVNTNIPNTITYRAQTCYTYTYSASCDWHVSGLASYLTVTPSSGAAGTSYTLNVCNTKTPTTIESSTFLITAGDNRHTINVNLTKDSGILTPSTVNITCLSQNVTFTFNPSCPITVTSIDSRLDYSITNNQLIVTVPRNESVTSAITWDITVKDCNDNTQTVHIVQDKTYERWVDTTNYVCESGNSYVKQIRYTGTTSSNINTLTSEYRKGSLITSGDTRCSETTTRWQFLNHYYCVDGDKYKALEEQVSTDGGTTWTLTHSTMLGDLVEADSSWCEIEAQYKWELTDKWVCDGGETPTPSYSGQYLTFVALESGTFSFSGTSSNTVEYSLDSGSTWTTLARNTSTPTVSSGQKIMWKGELTPTLAYTGIGHFSSTNNFSVEGNVMSLLYGDDFEGQTSLAGYSYEFHSLFSSCAKLVSAENLCLPATTLAGACYEYMFSNCTSLTTAPQLPATTLAPLCYMYMFYRCTSLTTVPSVLPATTLAENCYFEMFNGCTSLTTAPQLPATTLADGCYCYMFTWCTRLATAPQLPATTLTNSCYAYMFYNCTSLTTAPDLLAPTLEVYCYDSMFAYCSSLNYIKCLATNISATDCTREWVNGVQPYSGTFVKAAGVGWSSGIDGIPNGWTVQNA